MSCSYQEEHHGKDDPYIGRHREWRQACVLSEVLHAAAVGRADHECEQDRGTRVCRQATRPLRLTRPSNAPTAAWYGGRAAVGRPAWRADGWKQENDEEFGYTAEIRAGCLGTRHVRIVHSAPMPSHRIAWRRRC
jgi:hypothetical protein